MAHPVRSHRILKPSLNFVLGKYRSGFSIKNPIRIQKSNPIREYRNELNGYRLSANPLDSGWNPHRQVNHKDLAEHGWKRRRKYEEHEELFREFENLCFDPLNPQKRE